MCGVSDKWRAYAGIPNLPGNYQYMTVYHSQNFVNLVTGEHTNHVESYWMWMNAAFRKMNGTSAYLCPSYLYELMWHEWFGKTLKLVCLNYHLPGAAQKYPKTWFVWGLCRFGMI